jgi:hypothetical protein
MCSHVDDDACGTIRAVSPSLLSVLTQKAEIA